MARLRYLPSGPKIKYLDIARRASTPTRVTLSKFRRGAVRHVTMLSFGIGAPSSKGRYDRHDGRTRLCFHHDQDKNGRCNIFFYLRQRSTSSPYLVHFPDGHELVHRRSAHGTLALRRVVDPAFHARSAKVMAAVVWRTNAKQ